MLVLTRRIGEVIVINEDIRVTVVSIHGNRVRIGITAPESVSVDREEIHRRRNRLPVPDHQLEVDMAEV
jgi:carbon storage regulator